MSDGIGDFTQWLDRAASDWRAAWGEGPRPAVVEEPTPPIVTIRKFGYTMPVSIETLLWSGEITEEQARKMGWAPPPPLPRRVRLRWAIHKWWHRRPRVHFGPCNHEDCL